jgi:hypothetical protein
MSPIIFIALTHALYQSGIEAAIGMRPVAPRLQRRRPNYDNYGNYNITGMAPKKQKAAHECGLC